jgi:hypothetical protein
VRHLPHGYWQSGKVRRVAAAARTNALSTMNEANLSLGWAESLILPTFPSGFVERRC